MKKEYLYGIIGLLGGVIVAIAFTYNAVNTNNQGVMGMMGLKNYSNDKNNNSDIVDAHFIEQMIPHHEDAVTMSELAQDKASRPEVKELARNIIESQTKEIDQMKDWYKDWFGRELPTGDQVMNQHGMMGANSSMHMGIMGGDLDLESLENSEDFDRAFVEDMIPHHQMAVMMAGMLKNGTTRPEMKKLADDIIIAQTSEIDMMRKWLTEWE